MPLQNAEWHEILKVLHETVHIWSSGLTPLDYRRFLMMQMQTPWFRRNCTFTIFESGDLLRSSCKLYIFEFLSQGRTYRLAGLGAVYTQLEFRRKSFASDLLDEVIELCEARNYDGVILYSEIGTDFYADFGFEEFGSVDFYVESSACMTVSNSGSYSSVEPSCDSSAANLSTSIPPATSASISICAAPSAVASDHVLNPASSPASASLSTREFEAQRILEISRNLGASLLNISDVPFLQRHYSRWLRSQPFGMKRDEDYWQYKLLKENFLHEHCRTGWPALSLLKVDVDRTCQGYAIIVINAGSVRILEIIGTESARKQIWTNLLTQILKGRIERLDGWEGVIRDFAPTYKVRSLGPDNHLAFANLEVSCTQREWGQGMILCLNPDLQKWLSVNPCPMLELDHL